MPVAQAWKKKRRRGGYPAWLIVLCFGLLALGTLSGCCKIAPWLPPCTGNGDSGPGPGTGTPPGTGTSAPENDGSGSGCDTNCRGIVKDLEIVANTYKGQTFDASEPGGDLKPWKHETGPNGTTFGTMAAFEILGEGRQFLDYATVDRNCIMIQLVEGHRFLTNPDEKPYNNDEVYYLDGREETNEYNLIATSYLEDGLGWIISDDPAQTVKPGQSIEWREHYITFICEKCIESSLSGYTVGETVPLDILDTFDEYIVARQDWILQGEWTHPLNYESIDFGS